MQRTLVSSCIVHSAAVLTLGLACATPASGDHNDNTDDGGDLDEEATGATRLTALLTGRFDSSAQAAADTRYFAVQLRACAVSVPALGDHVLYVEQAMLSAVDQPYRQRVYAISGRDDGTVISVVNELAQPERFVGFCDLGAAEQTTRAPTADDIAVLPGCAVTLNATTSGFEGSTDGKSCRNDHSGAVYATSEVTLTDSGIESWDRGYDSDDVQVWGAVAGAYRFDRQQ
jgi:hypothetical protein